MGGMISTPAQLNQPSLLCNLMCKFIGFWGIRRRAYMSTRMHTTTYMDSPAYIVTYVMKHTRHICHATYTPTSTNKRIHARACACINIHRSKHINKHACATSLLQKAIPERSICAIPKRTIRATPKRPTAPSPWVSWLDSDLFWRGFPPPRY